MNLLLHMVRKDLRRLRWWLCAWMVVLALPMAVGAWVMRTEADADPARDVVETAMVLMGVQVCVAYLLVVLLWQEDRVASTQAFWRTRPISRARWLGAKLGATSVVIVVMPALVSWPWWLACGLGGVQLLQVFAHVAAVGGFVAVVAATIAVVADSLSRAVLWSVVLVAVGATASLLVAGLSAQRGSSEAELLLLILGASFAATLWLRVFQWRLWPIALVWVASAIAVAGIRSAPSVHALAPREHHAEKGAGLTVELGATRLGQKRSLPTGGQVQFVRTALKLQGAPVDPGLAGSYARQRWTWSDGTQLERWGVVAGSGTQTTSAASRSNSPWELQVEVPPSFAARLTVEAPRFEATLWFRLIRHQFGPSEPIVVGRRAGLGGYLVSVLKVTEADGALQVRTRMAQPDGFFRPINGQADSPRLFDWRDPARWFYREQIVHADLGPTGASQSTAASELSINGVRLSWKTHRVEPGADISSAEFLSRLRIQVSGRREEAVFSRTISVPRLEVE